MKNFTKLFLLVVAITLASVTPTQGAPSIAHVYNLSDFTGTVPYNHPTLYVDAKRGETYVLSANTIRIFNATGMEVYEFDPDPSLGSVVGLTVDENGTIFTLSYEAGTPDLPFRVTRCSYRGEPEGSVRISGLRDAFARILPDAIFYENGRLHLVSKSQMLSVVTDRDGVFQKGYDFAALLGIPEKDRPATDISGFSLDGSGTMLMTIPVQFRAFLVSPDGKVASFGKSGSAAGQFGIVSGIAADGRGNILVADKLRSVVMVFDRDFNFITEFGYRGTGADNLVRPDQVAVGEGGKVYITQLRSRGVAVFSLSESR